MLAGLGELRGRRGDDRRELARLGRHVRSPPLTPPRRAGGRRGWPPSMTTTSSSGRSRSSADATPSPSPGSASAPTTRVTSSPPADSSRSSTSRAATATSAPRKATSPSTMPSTSPGWQTPGPGQAPPWSRPTPPPCRVASRGAGHRDDVGVHRAAGVEHRERGQRLHGRAGGHHVHVEPRARRRLGGDLGGHQGVAVARQQHDGGRPGRLAPPRAAARRRPAGPGPRRRRRHRPRAAAPPMPGPAAQATTASGTGCSRPRRPGVAKWVIRIRSGRPAVDARLDGRARVVDVHVDVPEVGPAHDEQRVAEPVEGAP